MSGTGRVVLQKLLTGPAAQAIVEQGYDQVAGYVVEAGDVAHLRTPEALLAAYGFTGAPQFLDVVRFEVPPLASVAKPGELPGSTTADYPSGFLAGDSPAPVWELSRTRYPHGAEYWRLRSDGQQKVLSAYDGAARGWRGAQGWRPPSATVGPRARWRGQEFPADVVGDGVMLTLLGQQAPEGWEQIRPGVHAAAVPLAECEVFEVVITATASGVPVRLLDSDGTTAHVQVQVDNDHDSARAGGSRVEPGVFEAHVPLADLTDTHGITHELTTRQ